ncbi:TIR domain-containing protein [Celeribacter sp.]|uniref:RipA family octameric membrane protein n=1 Tax=Celeribacter sp. TaxID=1890673 RepID=UPI003A8C9337
MRAFLIHRTDMRKEARAFFASLSKTKGIHVNLAILKKSYGSKWQQQAESEMQSAEVVIVYDSEACSDSENTNWEIDRATELGKTIVVLSKSDIAQQNVGELQSHYDFSTEFDDCFVDRVEDPNQLLELYKIMVTSSEQLIQRRQITNGFFITVIGAIIGASGLLVKEKVLNDSTFWVLVFPIFIGLLMCRSWKNLIENYGKLNAGKFQVIHRIEQSFDAKIFAAEWVALGKGARKEKYQSFTSTEQNVPNLFSYLLFAALLMIFLSADWEPVLNCVQMILTTMKQIFECWFKWMKSVISSPSITP